MSRGELRSRIIAILEKHDRAWADAPELADQIIAEFNASQGCRRGGCMIAEALRNLKER